MTARQADRFSRDAKPSTPRKLAFVALERQYVDKRAFGVSASEAANQLKLTATTARNFEEGYREISRAVAYSMDSSTPRYAENDAHVAAINTAGGYPLIWQKTLVSADLKPWSPRA